MTFVSANTIHVGLSESHRVNSPTSAPAADDDAGLKGHLAIELYHHSPNGIKRASSECNKVAESGGADRKAMSSTVCHVTEHALHTQDAGLIFRRTSPM
jgi:hypothetical protein